MLVFVYGTLMSGGHNNYLLTDGEARFVGPAFTNDEGFKMISFGAFPGAVDVRKADYLDVDTAAIFGEVWDISGRFQKETLRRLDMLEGNGSFYTRKLEEIVLPCPDNDPDAEKESIVRAWIYLLPVSHLERGDRGDVVEFFYPSAEDPDAHMIQAWANKYIMERRREADPWLNEFSYFPKEWK